MSASVKDWLQLAIRVSPEDLTAWKAAARADGRSLASWVRVRLNEAVASPRIMSDSAGHTLLGGSR